MMNPTVACPSRDSVAAFLLGKGSEAEDESVGSHLDHCRHCQSVAQALETARDSVVDQLRESAGEGDPFRESPDLQRLVDQAKANLRRLLGKGTTMTPGGAQAGTSTGPQPPAPGDGGAAPPLPGGGQLRDYQLLGKLGEGGMGTVYRAVHTKLKRVVALKVLRSWGRHDAAALARFQREMEAVGKLDHPNIVRAFDAGEADGTHFLVMEYVEGQDLARLLEGRGAFPIAEACRVVQQAAKGLDHAYRHGLVHRDIKPSNLMLTPAGQVKVLDLGLALFNDVRASGAPTPPGQASSPEMTGSRLTMPGQVMGTCDYMAPEQINQASTVDLRADVYSLGCTLYHLLTGQVPFPADNRYQKMQAHQVGQATPLASLRPEVPEDLAKVVTKMMAKKPHDRYDTPGDVAAALEPFCGSTISDQPREGPRPARAKLGCSFSARLWIGMAAALLIVSGIVLYQNLFPRGDRRPDLTHLAGSIAEDMNTKIDLHDGEWRLGKGLVLTQDELKTEDRFVARNDMLYATRSKVAIEGDFRLDCRLAFEESMKISLIGKGQKDLTVSVNHVTGGKRRIVLEGLLTVEIDSPPFAPAEAHIVLEYDKDRYRLTVNGKESQEAKYATRPRFDEIRLGWRA
jgi:serine/threonine protein kinase